MTTSLSPFMVLRTVKVPGAPWLETIENVPDEDDLKFGVSRISNFPETASFSMSKDFPKDCGLPDAFKNVSSLLVVSERLKVALETIPGALYENELLSVKIINHKKTVEKNRYFIVHQINHPVCLDETKTQGIRMAINPKLFQMMTAMVVDAALVPEKKLLFRIAQYPKVPLVRRELAHMLEDGQFSGLEFHEIEGFNFLLA